ncbi:MAG: preprotein translocase subunit SecG [Chitinophagaceae bacterium]|nr:preprotein translocase subunit SecG [Bacteroidota bacterium]MCC6256881.1 preprotein translocase subunit SecG [Chitinophagaceae bacterium]MCW5916501.1 preprotein translocase subunit SecG [Ferruginibacter sp.]
MLVLFGILIILTSVILGLIVLIQNPKGGGLSGTFGGFGNQLMGVKQTTDALEKGTWIFAGVMGVLCILSTVFIPKNTDSRGGDDLLQNISTKGTNPTPAPTPANTVPLPADSNTK